MNDHTSPDKQMNSLMPRERLLALSPIERPDWLAVQLQHQIASILGVRPDEIPLDAPFAQLNQEWADLWRAYDALQAPVQALLGRSLYAYEFYRLASIGPIQSVRELGQHLADEFEIPAPQAPYTNLYQGGQWAWDPPTLPLDNPAKNRSMVFLFSSPRSGSTLLRAMLDRHPALFAGPELNLLPFESMAPRARQLAQLGCPWMDGGLVQTLATLERLTPVQAKQRLGQLIEDDLPVQDVYRLLQDRIGQRTLVDKSPLYSAHPAWLSRAENLFAEPKYVFVARHPCGCIESFVRMRFHWLRGNHDGVWDKNPWLLAEKVWALYNRNTLEFFADMAPQRKLVLCYEDLVTDPEVKMRELCAFLCIPFDDATLNPMEGISQRPGGGDPNLLTRRQIDPTLATAWKRRPPPQALSPFTREVAAELGYETSRDAVPLSG